MQKKYTGFYRTLLSPREKLTFKKLAIQEGSVTDVHDRLLREYISQKTLEEGDGSSQCKTSC